MKLPKANTKAYPWCIVQPTGLSHLVLMRFMTEEIAIANLEQYKQFGTEAKRLRVVYREN
jgi:hypothetical protein